MIAKPDILIIPSTSGRGLVPSPYEYDILQQRIVIPAKAGIQGWGWGSIRQKHMGLVLG